jgi:hypothetical protein
MPRTGSKKTRGVHAKTETQYCIDGVLVHEILADLSDAVDIIGARVIIGSGIKKKNVVVPAKLKKLGVQSIRQSAPASQITMVFDKVSKSTIMRKVAAVAGAMGVDPEKAYFSYLTVKNSEASGRFTRCKKDLRPDETDLRKKATVLGLTDASGKIAQMLSVLHATPYQCRIDTVEVRTFICTKS